MTGKRRRTKKLWGAGAKKHTYYIFLTLLVALAILAGVYFFTKPKPSRISPEDAGSSKRQLAADVRKEAEAKIKETDVNIFFLSPNGMRLKPQKMKLPVVGSLEERAAALLEMLAKGPPDKASFMQVPPFELKHIFIDQRGYAYLNLAGQLADETSLGALGEALFIYSLVDTVIFNIPEVKKVKILIDGQEKETFAGHIDISKPLGANYLLATEMPG